MAAPVLPVFAILAQGAGQALSKPWPWAIVGLWFISANFSLRVFSEEFRNTIWSLWWVVVLIIIGFIANSSLKVYFSERGKTQRHQISQNSRK